MLDRLGWDGSGAGDDDDTLLRASLIWTLGDLRDADTVAEARRRFAAFLNDPKSLSPALREAVTHVVGVSARREDYDALLALARKSTETNERVRYYYAAASARDGALAQDTLALTLTKELPSTLVNGLINEVAASGWHRELAWDFVQKNLAALTARQGPDFPHEFVPNFMTNFSDEAHADALRQFRAGAGNARRPGDDVARAGSDRDLRRPEGARAAGDRRLDQGASGEAVRGALMSLLKFERFLNPTRAVMLKGGLNFMVSQSSPLSLS